MSRRNRTSSRRGSGRRGEELATELLRAAGFRIVARNLRAADTEIDVLARRRRLYAAVEVKTRRWHPAPERLVDPDQRIRLHRALRALAPHLRPTPRCLRVDVVAVVLAPGREPDLRHFPGPEHPWQGATARRFWLGRLWTI